ncbi:hypothetical protein [Methylobacterium sp. WL19]|uniref:hypothetical protein n=1 Tax=Methylobacterium sp. WL19 TaxID=2603896 RepID=UPI0011CBDB73|nr:hypothetical protein [Methylobacterium sp. WL19]TXN27394.1 hypothetical protein FV220_11570 [Methylobacterium sp. WL19]
MDKFWSLLETGSKRPLIIASSIAFFAAIGLAIADKTSSASLCAAVFIVATLLHYFPQLESFKAIGVEAKLRLRLAEADEIMEKIKKLALVSGTQMYTELAYTGRLVDQRFSEAKTIADEMGEVLEELGFSSEVLRSAKKPYVDMIGVDLFALVSDVMQELVALKRASYILEVSKLDELTAYEPDHPQHKTYVEMNERSTSISRFSLNANFTLNELKNSTLDAVIYQRLVRAHFSDAELVKIDRLVRDVAEMHRDCINQNKMTEKALTFLETNDYGSEARKRMAGDIVD